MGKRRAKSLELLTSDQAAATAPPQAPRKRGRPRKVIQVKEMIAEPDGEREREPDDGAKPGVRGGEEEQQQQQEHDASPPPAAGKEEKFILEPTQDEEKPSSSRGRRKSQRPRKST